MKMTFQEPTDEQLGYIKPYLPHQPIVGRKMADDRKTISSILCALIIKHSLRTTCSNVAAQALLPEESYNNSQWMEPGNESIIRYCALLMNTELCC